MKKMQLPILILFFISPSFAQRVSLKKDTILIGKTPVALLVTGVRKPIGYLINSLSGQELIETHNARIEIKGQPAYVVTFLNDHKQAIVTKQKPFPLALIKELVKYNMIISGNIIDPRSETLFINTHPVPEGYTDIEQLIEY